MEVFQDDLVSVQNFKGYPMVQSVLSYALRVKSYEKDADCEQFAFDLYSLLLGFHLYDKLLDDAETKKRQEQALNQLVANYQ